VLLAGAYLRVKEYARAQRRLDDAHAVADLDQPELLRARAVRLQAELLLATGRR
jgi:hypothetical protein